VRKEIHSRFLEENLKRLFGRAWHRWEDVKVDIKRDGMGRHTLDSPVSGQALVPGYMADFLTKKETTSLSRQNLHHAVKLLNTA